MAVTFKIRDLAEALPEKVHNFQTDALMIALSLTAPTAEASNPLLSDNGILANVTQISYTTYSDDMTVDRRLEDVTSTETGGTYALDAKDIRITAVGGPLSFRYVYVYNDTPAGDPLIGCIDNETVMTLAAGESVDLRWHATGVLRLA